MTMNGNVKTALYAAGGAVAGVIAGVGIVKVAKLIKSKSKLAKKCALKSTKKQLETELGTLIDTQKVLDAHRNKVEEIMQNCYDTSTGTFKAAPGYEDYDLEFLTERSNHLGMACPSNKSAIFMKEMQIQTIEFELAMMNNKKKKDQVKG